MSTAPSVRYWIGVVSREHVLRGTAGGFAMLNHGRKAPLQRLSPGDWLIYYSPKTAINGVALKAFTAIGEVKPGAAHEVEMGPGRIGYRRGVAWLDATETPLARLSDALEFTQGHWGMLARRGLFEISAVDFQSIRTAMLEG